MKMRNPLAPGGGPGPQPGPTPASLKPVPAVTELIAAMNSLSAGAATPHFPETPPVATKPKPAPAPEPAAPAQPDNGMAALATMLLPHLQPHFAAPGAGAAPVVHHVQITDQAGQSLATIEGAHPCAAALARNVTLGMHTLIKGPAGSGKTHAVRQLAEALKRPLFIVGFLADGFQVTGFMNVQGEFVETEVSKYAEATNALLLLDEFDGYNPNAALVLNTALANGVLVTAKGQIHIDHSNVIIATANTWGIGATTEYVGRNRMDAATLDRFAKLEWDYDVDFELRIAMAQSGVTSERIPRTVQAIRANARKLGYKWVISPRATIMYCKLRKAGVDTREALRATCLSQADDEQYARAIADVSIA